MPGTNYVVTTPATQEQLTLSEMHTYLRVDYTDEDAFILQLITNARVYAEELLHRSLAPQTIQATIEPERPAEGALSGSIVGGDVDFYRYNERVAAIPFAFYGPYFELPQAPATAVSLVEYQLTRFDLTTSPNNPNWTTLASTDSSGNPTYILDANVDPTGIQIVSMQAAGRYRFTYSAGYAIGSCPQAIIMAMKALISFWFDNRQGEAIPDSLINQFVQKRVWIL